VPIKEFWKSIKISWSYEAWFLTFYEPLGTGILYQKIEDIKSVWKNPYLVFICILCPMTWWHHVSADAVSRRRSRMNEMTFGYSHSRTHASVADYITLLIDSHHGSPARYLYPARHELTSPRRARSNETFVIITHQSIELRVINLQEIAPESALFDPWHA